MKARALLLGIVVSVVLSGVAGALYVLSAGGAEGRYRAAVALTRQIQQLSSQWSVEIARVKSDPLVDFDSLAAFIPRMAQRKRELLDTARGIAGLPEGLASGVDAYLNALEVQEDRIERFKSGYAVVRSSTRYLLLAAANVTRQAQEARKQALARSIAVLVEDMNLFLSNPTETGRARLAEEMERLREASVAQSPALGKGLANFVAHAEVLLDRQGPTEELFQKATSSDIGDLTERLVGSFEFELGKRALEGAWYERGMLAVIGVLAIFWMGLALQQRVRGVTPEAPAPALATDRGAALSTGALVDSSEEPMPAFAWASEVPEKDEEDEEDLSVALLATAGSATRVGADDANVAPALSPAVPATGVEKALLQGFLARCVADNLAASASHIATHMSYLHQAQSRIRQALQDNDALLPALSDGADLDEEIQAVGAIAAGVRRETNAIADLARRLAASAVMPNGTLDRDMVDLNACVEGALRATHAEEVATVARRLGDLPEIFASHAEIRLLLIQVIENSVHAVQGLQKRDGSIKVDTARRNDDILVTVIDNGTGLNAEQRAKIFRPFYTSRAGAIGLGLTLASYLATKYEGDIKVNSLPDQGTVTRITLPTGTRGA